MPNQILILEKNQQDTKLLATLFEQQGASYQVDFVNQLADAHGNLQKQRYDLILCSSDFAAIAFTELQSQCSCPCILLGKKDEETKIAELMHKFNNYVIKDNTGAYFQILLALIKANLDDKTPEDENILGKLTSHHEEYREKFLLLQAIQLSTFPIILVDAKAIDLPIVYTNPASEKMTGYSLYEILGKNCRILQGTDTKQAGLEIIRAAIRRGENCNVTIRNYRKDGSMFWNNLNISPIYDQAGELTHFLGVQHDVTEQKNLEAERSAIAARYQHIVEDQVDLVFRYDKNLQITFANDAYCKHYGLSANEIIGQSILAKIPPEKHAETSNHVYSLSQENPLMGK
jgi:PAS domain S-box-containing protein